MIKIMMSFLKDLYKSRKILWTLIKNDSKERYLGSYLGILWAFIQPLFTICIMWFVFSFGFRVMPIDDVPFILWLSAGMIPWFFISESVALSASSILEKSFLVKKVVFRVSLLPMIKIFSALLVHLFFVFILILMFGYYGYYPDLYFFQLFYYIFAAAALVLSVSYITSSVVVFTRDFGQLVGICIQFLFWATPIFWNLNLIPAHWRGFFQLNPCWYIVNGFRDTLIYKKWFWESPDQMLCFWGLAFFIGVIGILLFKKLKPHFADVL